MTVLVVAVDAEAVDGWEVAPLPAQVGSVFAQVAGTRSHTSSGSPATR